MVTIEELTKDKLWHCIASDSRYAKRLQVGVDLTDNSIEFIVAGGVVTFGPYRELSQALRIYNQIGDFT